MSFWQDLPKPIVGLAPMDGVTDAAFRFITKKYGKPDIMFTEFTSVEGWSRGAKDWQRNLLFDQSERPIIAQVYGKTPQFFYDCAKKVAKMGYDGIDINMGCPSKSVNNSGSGAALIKTPQLAQEIVLAVQKVVDDSEQKIPISIKTRLGYEDNIIETWLPLLLQTKPTAITIHGRTFRQGYSGQADWQSIGRAVEIAKGSGVLILGNGDVKSRKQAEEKTKKYGVDGILIGRAAYGNPWVFSSQQNLNFKQIAKVSLEHAQVFEQYFKQFDKGEGKYFMAMRKHLAWYIKGVEGAKQLRQQLVRANDSQQVAKILGLAK